MLGCFSRFWLFTKLWTGPPGFYYLSGSPVAELLGELPLCRNLFQTRADLDLTAFRQSLPWWPGSLIFTSTRENQVTMFELYRKDSSFSSYNSTPTTTVLVEECEEPYFYIGYCSWVLDTLLYILLSYFFIGQDILYKNWRCSQSLIFPLLKEIGIHHMTQSKVK